jgi:NAD(P)H dehydrogenase (quinone)
LVRVDYIEGRSNPWPFKEPSMTSIAITGASGKLGRATLQALSGHDVPAGGVFPVMRDPAKGADLAAKGFQVRRGDYTDPASLEAAFKGVERLLFISTSALGEERMLHHRNVVTAAKRAGVGHILYTSVIKPSADAKFGASPGHFHTEALIRESGIPHTFFQNNLYLDIIPFLFGSAVQTGVLTHCAGQGRIGFIARDDIAQALAAALTSAQLKQSYAITVNRPAYTFDDVAAALGKSAGKPVKYNSVSPDEFRSILEGAGVPPAGAAMAVAIGEATRAGEFDASSPDLERLLGRPPVSLDAFLSRG